MPCYVLHHALLSIINVIISNIKRFTTQQKQPITNDIFKKPWGIYKSYWSINCKLELLHNKNFGESWFIFNFIQTKNKGIKMFFSTLQWTNKQKNCPIRTLLLHFCPVWCKCHCFTFSIQTYVSCPTARKQWRPSPKQTHSVPYHFICFTSIKTFSSQLCFVTRPHIIPPS